MSESSPNRSIRIEGSAVGSSIISGDGNTVYVIHQSAEYKRIEASAKAPTKVGSNPYKGLAAFKEDNADQYFGREAQVKRLFQHFQALYEQSICGNAVPRLLPILGPSGCGKSSLARAGLIPELARRPLPGKEQMQIAVLVPGIHPVEALAGVLAKAVTQDPMPVEKTREFTTELWLKNEAGLYDGMRRIVDLMPQIDDMPLVVLVDQFEEVYSLCQKTAEREVFIDNLLNAASSPTGSASVVLTLRSDFLGETQRHPLLTQVIGSDQSVIVPGMTEAELRRAITEPAKRAGYPLDEATVNLLVQDTEGREGALPLLQFALTQIWEGLSDGNSPAETYQKIGGVGGALAGKAQEIYNELEDAEQDIVRRVFIGLVQLGEGTRDTRRRATLSSLTANQDTSEFIKQVIDRFSSPGARLVTLSSQAGEEIAEVTHEALFDHWQLLNDWLDSSRDDIRFQRRLEAAAQYWQTQGKPSGLLWRPPDLDLLETYELHKSQEMTELETDFWNQSYLAEKRRKQNKRLITGGLTCGFVLASVSTGIALWNMRAATRNSIKTLAQSATSLNASGRRFDALIVSLRARQRFQDNWLQDTAILNHIEREFYAAALSDNREMSRLEGHTDELNVARFSPDGNIIATSSEDHTAKLWKSDGTLITTLEGHTGGVTNLQFSLDGSIIATTSTDNTAKLWKSDGTLITTLEGHTDGVFDVQFSPDNSTIATASHDNTAKLWKLNGELITTFEGHTSGIWRIQFSPDNSTIATASIDSTAKLWKPDGTLITTLKGHTDSLTNITFSPDGSVIGTTSVDHSAKLWKPDGTLITTLEGHTNTVTTIKFHPDGNSIATASRDDTAKLWQTSGKLIATLEGHADEVEYVIFSPDGTTIATASQDNTAKLWKPDGTLITTLEGHTNEIWNIQFSPDSRNIATASHDNTAKLWTIKNTTVTTLEGHTDTVTAIRFSPDGEAIATANRDGKLKLWKTDGSLIATIEGHTEGIWDVQFSPDGNTIATAGRDGATKLWTTDGSLITTLRGHTATVIAIKFSPNSTMVLTASAEDNAAKLWSIDGSLITTLKGHTEGIDDVRFSPDGKSMLTASRDDTAKLWNIDGSLITTLRGHLEEIRAARFSPDGSTIATTSNDNTAKLWTTNGALVATLESHTDGIEDVRFSPDGDTIATAGRDNTGKLWGKDGALIATLEGHTDRVDEIRFSPDGNTIATASRDNTIKLWTTNGVLIATLEGHTEDIWDVHFSPDGNTIASASKDSTAKLWLWRIEDLMFQTCQNIRGYLRSSPNLEKGDSSLCDEVVI